MRGAREDVRTEAASLAAAVIGSSDNDATWRVLVEAGGVPALVSLLSSSDVRTRAAATAALSAVSAGGPDAAALVFGAGAIPAAVEILDADIAGAQGAATTLLCNVMYKLRDEEERLATIAAAGAIPKLVKCLASHLPDVQARAAEALAPLCKGSPQRCREAAGAGAIAALQHLLQDSSEPEFRKVFAELLKILRPTGQPAPSPATPMQRPAAPRVCAAPGCGATHGLHRCGGCGMVPYCSTACSRAHWCEHRAECRRLQAEQAAATDALASQQQQQQQ